MKENNFFSKFLQGWNNFKICKRFKFWVIAPIAIILVAIIVVAVIGGMNASVTEGLNIGIDFEGGTMLSVKFGEDALTSSTNYSSNVKAVTEAIESYGLKVTYVQSSQANVKEDSSITFRYKNISDSDSEIAKLNDKVKASIEALYPTQAAADTDFIMAESIGKTASTDLINKAVIALCISTLLILIYIIFRFEVVSGIAAIITMFHDVIIMFALTVIFRIQINSSYVAAAITIIAYAINNTIIVFDRCREALKPLKGKRGVVYEEIGDAAIKSTFNRQVYTTFTTMITVAFLAILGGASIREFTVPILLGLFVGFYSTIFIATPIWSRLSYVAENIREKRLAGKKTVVYETIDDAGNIVEQKEDIVGEEVKVKKPKANSTYKYSKKNTTFKKK